MDEMQLHSGHRERMLNRFASFPDSLNDHEILEIILYNLVPRIDTNPLAHRILRVFGSLGAVFNATEKELMTVKGVGRKVALGILAIGNVYRRIPKEKAKKLDERWINLEVIERNLRTIFTNYVTERFVMVLFNHKYVRIFHLEFEDKSKNSVTMEVPEVISAFAVYKPTFALVAHSHPSGVATPSYQDDFTTKKLNILCEIHNVKLIDHVILTKNDKFSYYRSGRLDDITKNYDLKTLLSKIEEKGNE